MCSSWPEICSIFLFFLNLFSLPGDFGFDPLGLGEDPESLKWYVQAELVHARFAMLGVAGILLTDVSNSYLFFPWLPKAQVIRNEYFNISPYVWI